jgi:hypothetical protein
MTFTRGLRALLACVAALVLAPGVAHAATITSTTSGDWSDPATWVGGVVPDTADTAVIKTGHSVTLTGDVTVSNLTLEGGATLALQGSRLTSSGDVTVGGDYYSTSWVTGGPLDVAGHLLVQNAAFGSAVVTATGTTEFSGPLPGDPEATSFWQNSTFTQNFGSVTLSGHKFTGDLDPVLNDAVFTVRGTNDFGNRQLTLTGWGGLYFEPTALSGINGAPMLNLGALVVTGMRQTTVDWSDISGPAGGDRINLITAPGGDATDLIYSSSGVTIFGGPLTGEELYVTYDGAPRPAANPLPSVSASTAMTGHALVGDTITCAPGTWTPDGTKAYSWTADGTPISGETASTFTATHAEWGTDVKCVVAVTAGGVTGTAASSNAVHVDIPPGSITDPEVTSANADPTKASVGDVLTCDPGLWSANNPTYTYSWQRDGMPLAGTNSSTYTVVALDKGTEITCEVYATDGLAESPPAASAGSVEISAGPAATTPPSATSTRTPSNRATTGDVLTCNPGVWNPDGTKTYAWRRDNTPIANATASTYTVVVADLGTDLKCSVTVTASGQSGSADSAAVTVVAAPTNSVAPSITGAVAPGTSKAGVQLTCDAGTWTLSPTFTYAWKRGATEVATTTTYTPVDADAGHTLTCAVTATTSDDVPSAPVSSAGVAIIPVPDNTAAPTLSGDGVVGTTLTCAPGGWVGTPALAYAWTRGGTSIAGASSSTYTVIRADRNAELRCVVTATALDFERTATSTPVTAKAATPITITEQPEAVVATRSTRVAYTLAADVTVTGCSLNGTALASCASPIALDSLASHADNALVLNLRNEYGEDETRTVSFATRISGPSLLVRGWKGKAASYQPVKATFEVSPGAMVACTLGAQPVACTPAGIEFLAPRSGEHVFQVTATDAHGASTTETLELSIKESAAIVPRKVTMTASTTTVLPSSVDLTGWPIEGRKARAVGEDGHAWFTPQATPVTFGPDSFGLRFKAPATPGAYTVVLRVPNTTDKEPITVTVVAADDASADGAVGGVTNGKGPLTCTKGTPGTLYSWYVNDKLVRTDTSNEFPASMVPKNGVVECAAIDPEKGALPREQALAFDGVRAGVTITAGGLATINLSAPTEISISLSGEDANGATLASASKAKPKKARYKTLKTFTKKLKKGSNKVKLGVKLPKRGYKLTLKIKKGKRYSKPLVLSKR